MVAQLPLFVPLDGRIPSQNLLVSPLDGTEAFETVWPGNNAQGNTYYVTLDTLAAFISAFPALNRELILSGATSINPYAVLPTDTQILFDKTLAAASCALLPLSATMIYPGGVVFKDLRGDASTNNITISFTGGELCDGLSTVVIQDDYGWTTINPLPQGNGWFQT